MASGCGVHFGQLFFCAVIVQQPQNMQTEVFIRAGLRYTCTAKVIWFWRQAQLVE